MVRICTPSRSSHHTTARPRARPRAPRPRAPTRAHTPTRHAQTHAATCPHPPYAHAGLMRPCGYAGSAWPSQSQLPSARPIRMTKRMPAIASNRPSAAHTATTTRSPHIPRPKPTYVLSIESHPTAMLLTTTNETLSGHAILPSIVPPYPLESGLCSSKIVRFRWLTHACI